jgi:hypothetical protein
MIFDPNALGLVVAFVDVAKARPGDNEDDEEKYDNYDDTTAGNHLRPSKAVE